MTTLYTTYQRFLLAGEKRLVAPALVQFLALAYGNNNLYNQRRLLRSRKRGHGTGHYDMPIATLA